MYLKVCGMRNNITEVATLKPDYLGFIFWEPSKRYFEGTIPPLAVTTKKVGVFVDAPIDEVVEKVRHYSLQLVQLHGSESPEYCGRLHNALWASDIPIEFKYERKRVWADYDELDPVARIIKVFSVSNNFDFRLLESYEPYCDFFMFDTKGELPGGNGFAFDWTLLQHYPSKKPYFLSGGIGLEDTDKLKEFLNSEASNYCYALDVNSRFETAPGQKDAKKLQEFIDALDILN